MEISSATSFFAHHRLQSTYTSIQLQRKVEQLLPGEIAKSGRNRNTAKTRNNAKTSLRTASMDRNYSLHSESKTNIIRI